MREAVALVRAALAGETDELDADLVGRAFEPRVYVVDAETVEGEQAYAALRATAPRPVPPLPDPEKLACLLYTSGTSGRPRAAMLTHRALVANIEQAAQVEPPMIHGDDVVLGVLPLFHVYGLNAVLGSVLRHRAKLVLVDHFDPQATLDLIDDEAVQRRTGGAAGVRLLAARGPPARAARPGPADAVGLGAAVGGADRASSPTRRASRSTRATASPRRRRS